MVGDFPEPDSRTIAADLVTAGGGPAATAAVAAARAGARTAFLGSVGADEAGDRVLAGLQDEGVDVRGVTRQAGQATGASIIIVASAGATRAIITRPVAPLDLDHAIARDLLRAADWVHVDHIGWPALHALRMHADSAFDFRLSIDGGNPIAGLQLRETDLYVPTLDRLTTTSAPGPSVIEAALQGALAEGAATVVATQGANGAWTLDDDGLLVHVAPPVVEVRSTLGAGDVFHGALVAAMATGYGTKESVEYAVDTAAVSCAGLDGRSAIPRRILPPSPAGRPSGQHLGCTAERA